MLYYKNNEWHICSEKVKYIQGEVELENNVGVEGRKWWEENSHVEIMEFTDITATQTQIARLEEVNKLNINDGHSEVLGNYVIDNRFPIEVNHILKNLQNKKENEMLKQEANILKTKLQSANDVAEFQEELIVELAMKVY